MHVAHQMGMRKMRFKLQDCMESQSRRLVWLVDLRPQRSMICLTDSRTFEKEAGDETVCRQSVCSFFFFVHQASHTTTETLKQQAAKTLPGCLLSSVLS